MRVFGLDITRARTMSPAPVKRGGWWPLIVREPYTGAWQRNDELRAESVLGYFAVFACITIIANDISKLGLRLVQEDENGIWSPVTTAQPFSPVLRKPNHYQNRIAFVQQWLSSKLSYGNTYALKQRDARGIVTALYVLDPSRVTPLVAPDGSVFYDLRRDDLGGLTLAGITQAQFDGVEGVPVPAREIIHDLMVPLFHPLCGVTPLFACGLAALQGLKIQQNSTDFFANASQPGGVLTAPGEIGDDVAKRIKTYWTDEFGGGKNIGKVAVLGSGLKYEAMAVNATDAQLIEQLQWGARNVCSCYHVPAYMVDVGEQPNFNNIEALNQQYYSQCLQVLIESFELCLDEGLELPKPYGTEFDLHDLIRMDTPTKAKAASDGIGAGALSPNEARKRYFDLGPVVGGDTPYLQQQNFSLRALAERDANDPFSKPSPAPTATTETPPELTDGTDDEIDVEKTLGLVIRKMQTEPLYA